MEGKWERRKILIWGKTRPEVSKSYREIVCTGGVFADTKRLVRLYPIPLRYMDDEKIFKKYQWIEADVKKADNDARPESYRIRADGIQVFDTIPSKSGNWDARAEWIMHPQNIFQSVEELQSQQLIDLTSLGLVKPKVVTKVTAEPTNRAHQDEFWKRYQDSLQQMALPMEDNEQRDVKPLKPPEYKFKFHFRCDDPRCKQDHEFGILDWEVDALYFGCRQRQGDSPQVASQKVLSMLRDDVCSEETDLYFYLGNISNHPRNFTIVGLWRPKKQYQSSLFGPGQI